MSGPPPLPPPLSSAQEPQGAGISRHGAPAEQPSSPWNEPPPESPRSSGSSAPAVIFVAALVMLGAGVGFMLAGQDDIEERPHARYASIETPTEDPSSRGLAVSAASSEEVAAKTERKVEHDPGTRSAWDVGVEITTPGLAELQERQARKAAADPGADPAIEDTY